MNVRRKSRWRSGNNKRATKFSAMRAAKERKRLARMLDTDAGCPPWPCPKLGRAPAPLFRVTIRCRDGQRVSFAVTESSWGGLFPSVSAAVNKVRTVLANYRPARTMEITA